MSNILTLNLVPIGEKCKVKDLTSTGSIRRRMLDLGLTYDTVVEPLQKKVLPGILLHI